MISLTLDLTHKHIHAWACLTSHVRSSLSFSLGIHSADLGTTRQGQTWDLPGPVREASIACRARTPLAISMCSVLPSVHFDAVGTPEQTCFRSPIPGPYFPLSTLRLLPCDRKRMTRGRCDSAMSASYETYIHYFPPVCRRTKIQVKRFFYKFRKKNLTTHFFLFTR